MEKSELQKFVDEGLTIKEIGVKFGISPTPVRRWLSKYNLRTHPRRSTWTYEQMVESIKNNGTIADVLRKLGLAVRPGNYDTVRNFVKTHSIDLSHMKEWRKANRPGGIRPKQLSDVLKENSSYSRSDLKARLIKEKIIQEVCAVCGQGKTWKGRPLTLILDHINGINNDNRLENLRFLCPNCNSQQPTFCRGKRETNFIRNDEIRPKRKYICSKCGAKMSKGCKLCHKCDGIRKRKLAWPSRDQLQTDMASMNWCALGRKYGVSDNAVRKWARKYGLLKC